MDPLQDSSEDVDWYEDGDNEKYQIYVGNLPNTLPEEQLKNLFEEYQPKRFRVFREGYKCFAFVSFEDSITMHHVLRQLNNCSLEGRCLVVSKSHRTSRSSCSSLQDLQLPDSTGEIKDYDQNCTEEKEIADNTFDEEEGYYNGRDVTAYSKAGEMPKDPVEEYKGTTGEFNKTDFAAASKDNFKQTYKEKSDGKVSPRNSNCGGWEDVPVQCCCSDDQSCSDVEQDVSCTDFKKIRYCILKLEKKKLELEILKLRLEIQKLNKCGFRNKE
ncbi:uncharacterized protein XB5727634.L isoform X2 [Xenopus laevis]|nr:uncharacterized protein XB5727634.L isoform X2 [Xenopus laevis]XP_041426197.1 uncharacterized protein XB5727634.L isoform X2 [Xenopus laevis]OCT71570.1 hypothetical protein XELAEV_18034548mg [Xenopus laevis]